MLLPKETAAELDSVYKNPQPTTEGKVRKLLEAFPAGRVVLLLDNFEDTLDENRKIKDVELDEALKTVLNAPQHGIKVIITTRIAPRELMMVQSGRQRLPLEWDSGLGSPYAENVLREMDSDDKLGLKGATDATLKDACERVMGYPRALEALVAALAADRETTLEDILKVAEKVPENVTQVLVGEAFNRLEPAAQKVMQTLAIYGRPVPEVAVDFLLQPYITGINSAPILGRLVNMHFVRRESGRYYLHPVDKQYALSLLPDDEASDRFELGIPPFTQVALHHRGAAYFASTRKPRDEWKKLEDLRPQLDEFDLRCEAEDWDTGANVLRDIDECLALWGHYGLMVRLHERLREKVTNWQLILNNIWSLGISYYYLSETKKALTCFEQALQLVEAHNERRTRGRAITWLGNIYSDLGQIEKAIEFYEQAIMIAHDTDDKEDEGYALSNLGNRYVELRQMERAIDYYQQVLIIARQINSKGLEGSNLVALGNCYSDLGQMERAISYYQQALIIFHEIGDRLGEGVDLGNLGNRYADLGQVEKAIEYF